MLSNVRESMASRFKIVLIYLTVLLTIVALLLAGCSNSSKDESETGEDVSVTSPTPVDTIPTEVEDDDLATVPAPTDEVDEIASLDRIVLDPTNAELSIGETQTFTAIAYDTDGNEISEIEITWEITEDLGSISDDGVLTAGTKAGTYGEGVKAIATLDGDSVEVFASVTVNAGPPDSIAISAVEIAAGETQQLEVAVADEYGNPVGDLEGAWTLLDENAGMLTESGLLTAGEVAGGFTDVVQVEVEQEGETHTAVASVTVIPGSLDQVVIAPDKVSIGIEMTQRFVAVGADQYGNRINGLDFAWSVENDGGTIDEKGFFTAGKDPETYKDTVKVMATQEDTKKSVTATVIVEPDRIAFISDREDDRSDIYIMNANGKNVERITSTSDIEFAFSWSPDGRRIAYDVFSTQFQVYISAMNDDGSWQVPLITSGYAWMPAWSPDGTRIAYSAMDNETDTYEIFVADIDGGNAKQITHTPNGMAYRAAWSPDGKKILYDYTIPDDEETIWGPGDIYVINANGFDEKRLTTNSKDDTIPCWSPDGKKILFTTQRDGDYEIYIMNADGFNMRKLTNNLGMNDIEPSWSPDGTKIVFASNRDISDAWMDSGRETYEIYVMDIDGENVKRLTNNSAHDGFPRWAPRKRGVEMDEASVVIPNTSSFKGSSTVQEATAVARSAVVRIETDLGSGSGFIIDSDGLIMTNNHVIVDAEEITVYLDDGASYDGIVKNREMIGDLAIVEIDATKLPVLRLGDAGQLSLGQQVLVLGYPLGSENVSPTSGIVSSVEFDSGRGITWVKTDSAVNPGNSGGPLLNLQGEVVGVVASKVVGVAVEGIGYAISANTVNGYLPELLSEE